LQIKDRILILFGAFEGSIPGKTMLQKRLFFIGELLGYKDLGYVAYYYGPFSQIVASSANQLVSLGFLEEKTIGYGADAHGFERRRIDYYLTDDGKEVLGYLNKKYKDEAEAIKEACYHLQSSGDPDYVELSYAAKAYFLLKEEGRPMAREEIRAKAETFHWHIPRENLDQAIDFLIKLTLAKQKSPTPNRAEP
jgi:uncharacterized protein YwgA